MNSLHGHSADRQSSLIGSRGLFKPSQADGVRTNNDRTPGMRACRWCWRCGPCPAGSRSDLLASTLPTQVINMFKYSTICK